MVDTCFCCVLVRLCTTVAKYLTEQLKEGRIYFTHSFRDLSPSWRGEYRSSSDHCSQEAEKEYQKGSRQYSPQDTLHWPPPQGGLSTSLLQPSPNAFVLWIHQGINPLIRPGPSGPKDFPKAHQLITKAHPHEPVGAFPLSTLTLWKDEFSHESAAYLTDRE